MSKLRLHDSSQNQAETSTEMDGDVIMERYQQSSRRYNEIEDDFVQLGFSALERNSILNDEDGRAGDTTRVTSTPNKSFTGEKVDFNRGNFSYHSPLTVRCFKTSHPLFIFI